MVDLLGTGRLTTTTTTGTSVGRGLPDSNQNQGHLLISLVISYVLAAFS